MAGVYAGPIINGTPATAMSAAFFTGLFTGLGLIVAIGAQNAFVIRQGLLRRHVFAVTTMCFLFDTLLIALGVAGLGTVIATTEWLRMGAAWGGAAFLIWFGLRSLRNAVRADHRGLVDVNGDGAPASGTGRRAAVMATLAFSLLNPHVYLDTVVLLGSIGGQYALGPRLVFLAGAALASALWFYAIGYGSALAAPLFRKPIAAQLLDGFVAAVMAAVAAMLIYGELS